MSFGGRLRITAFVLIVLAVIGLSLAAAFVDAHAHARNALAVAIAALMSLLRLLFPPALRPSDAEAVPRSAPVAFIGRFVTLAAWLTQVLILGFGSYFVSRSFQEEPGFQARVALLTFVGQLLALVTQCGRSMAGFRPDWGFSRSVPSVLRYLLNTAFLICLAGYASTLPGVVETAAAWLPNRVHDFWTGLLPGWLAVPLTVVVCAVWFFAVLALESALQRLLAAALGAENSLGEWLGNHIPVSFQRTDTSVTFDFDFWLIRIFYYNSSEGRAGLLRLLLEARFNSDYPSYGRGPTAKQRRKWQAHERPLTDEERQRLHDEIGTAMVAEAPPEWGALTLEYRAVTEHQEVQLTVDPPGGRFSWHLSGADEDDTEGTARITRQLPDFPARDALWRLHEASYSVAHGVEYVHTMTVAKAEPARGRQPDDRPWRLHTSPWYREQRPAWEQPPTARQYRRDLRRFPAARGRRPFWLRNAVKRIG